MTPALSKTSAFRALVSRQLPSDFCNRVYVLSIPVPSGAYSQALTVNAVKQRLTGCLTEHRRWALRLLPLPMLQWYCQSQKRDAGAAHSSPLSVPR